MSNKCKIHKYKRVKLPTNQHTVFKCVLCPHYVLEYQVIGRDAVCWYCGNVFKMSHKSLLLKPHCGCRSNDDTNLTISKKKSKAPKPVPDDLRTQLVDYLIAKSMGTK